MASLARFTTRLTSARAGLRSLSLCRGWGGSPLARSTAETDSFVRHTGASLPVQRLPYASHVVLAAPRAALTTSVRQPARSDVPPGGDDNACSLPLEAPLDVLVHRLHTTPPSLSGKLDSNFLLRSQLAQKAEALAHEAYATGDAAALAELHKTLACSYDAAFSIPSPRAVRWGALSVVRDIVAVLEHAMMRAEEARADQVMPGAIPSDAKAFVRWIVQNIRAHKAATHPFYTQFMAEEATRDALRYWLAQETLLDPRFDDILALMQVGARGRVKMEIASNYWDEMGNGDMDKVHTHLFAIAIRELNVSNDYIAQHMLPESRVVGNLSAAMVLQRCYFYRAIGYYGVTELLAPDRFAGVIEAFRRNGISEAGQSYHKLHVWIDRIHGAGWFNKAIRSLVAEDPSATTEIARGVWMRLETSAHHLDQMLAASRRLTATPGMSTRDIPTHNTLTRNMPTHNMPTHN